MVALGGVVVDDVQDHLDAGRVQRLDHRLELLHLLAQGLLVARRRGVVRMRCQEGERVVAPVVAQPLLDQGAVLDELVDRHQLDRGHPELGQVVGDRGVGQAGVGAAQLLGDVGVELGQPLDVGLVDDRLVVGDVRAPVTLPVEERVDHDAVRHVRPGVVVVARVRVAEVVAEQGLVPVDLAAGCLGVGVEEQLVGVAPQPAGRVPRTVDAVAVALPGLHRRQVAVPDEGVHLGELDPLLRELLALAVDEAQLDPLGDLAEQGEVRAAPVEGRAQRVGRSGPGLHAGSSSLPAPVRARPPRVPARWNDQTIAEASAVTGK